MKPAVAVCVTVRLVIIILLAAQATPSRGLAYAVRDLPLESKARLSTVVVVGTVSNISRLGRGEGRTIEYATIKVQIALKGSPPPTLRVIANSSIAEARFPCCRIGARYLLFLVRTNSSGVYGVLDGQFGIYDLEQEAH